MKKIFTTASVQCGSRHIWCWSGGHLQFNVPMIFSVANTGGQTCTLSSLCFFLLHICNVQDILCPTGWQISASSSPNMPMDTHIHRFHNLSARFSRFHCHLGDYWPILLPLPKLPTAFHILLGHIFQYFGILEDIVSFTSRVWTGIMNKLGISVSLTSGYHSQANGKVERAN